MTVVGAEPSLHCNACGCEVPIKRSMGRQYKVCSPECIKEMEWRNACHLLGKPYRHSPETLAWARDVLGEPDKKNEG